MNKNNWRVEEVHYGETSTVVKVEYQANIMLVDDPGNGNRPTCLHRMPIHVIGVGAAFRDPKDTPDKKIGYKLAHSRAKKDAKENFKKLQSQLKVTIN